MASAASNQCCTDCVLLSAYCVPTISNTAAERYVKLSNDGHHRPRIIPSCISFMCARCPECPMILCVYILVPKRSPSSLRWLELKADTNRQRKNYSKLSRWQYSVKDARCARTFTKMSGSPAQRHLGRLRALGSVARSPASERPDSTQSPQYHLSVVIGVLSCCHVAFCSFALTSSVAASSGTPFGSLSARHLRRSRVLADALGKQYMCARGCKSSPACCAASAQQLPRERSPFAPARNPKGVNTPSRAFLLSSGNKK